MNFPTELRGHVFRHLSLPELVPIGPAAFLSLDRSDRVALALGTGPEHVSQLFANGEFGVLMARFVIERHLAEANGCLRRYHLCPDRGWRVVLDHAVTHRFPNKLLVRMLHHGATGEMALEIAAEMRRFDTVRALYHNDWYGELYFRESLREECLRADDLPFLKWIWLPFLRRKDPSVTRDLYLWLLMCCDYDAVKCFSYLYHERSSYCCSSILATSIKHKAVRIAAFLIENCRAVQMKQYEATIRGSFKRETGQHMRKHLDRIKANDGAEKCSHRFIVPHMDWQHVWSNLKS